jgi:signal transduction histidine kinase
MNPKNDNLDSFTAYIRRYASTYLETDNMSVRFNFPFVVPELPMSAEVCRNLFLTVKEALHNIVKHSKAKNVKLAMLIDGNNLVITITDDGHGFRNETIRGSGNGLINMQKRIEECGGQYLLVSEDGKGTEIKISVTL